MTTEVVVVANEVEARARAERIRVATEDLSSLLTEAHDSEDWRALGYESWHGYLEGEFSISIRRVNQLLTQGRVNKALKAAGSDMRVTEPEARLIAKGNDVPDVPEIEERVAERRASSKPKGRPKRPMPSLDGLLWNIQRELVAFSDAAGSFEDEQIAAGLLPDQRIAIAHAAQGAYSFYERVTRILAIEVVRDEFESA